MGEIDDYSFVIVNEQGMEVKCDLISVINDNETDQTYLIYTDYLLTKTNKFRILVSELKEENGNYVLKDVNDKDKLEQIKNTSLTLHAKAYKRLQEKYANLE